MVCGLLLADVYLLVPLFLFAGLKYGALMGSARRGAGFHVFMTSSVLILLGLNAVVVLFAHGLRWLFVMTTFVLGFVFIPYLGEAFLDIFKYDDNVFSEAVFLVLGMFLWGLTLWWLATGVESGSDKALKE